MGCFVSCFFPACLCIVAAFHVFAVIFQGNIFRVLRVIRILRVLKVTKGIRTLIRTLFSSLPSLVNVASLLFLLFFLFALLGMQLFGKVCPPVCGVCGHANHVCGAALAIRPLLSGGGRGSEAKKKGLCT